MRLFVPVMLVSLLVVSACKKKPRSEEGTQEQADAYYVTSTLSRVCDGAKIPEAKAYGPSAPHSIVIVGGFAESTSGSFAAVATPKTSIAETELVGCVEYAGNGNSGGSRPARARVIRARDGVELARFEASPGSGGALEQREALSRAFDPYVRGAK